MRLLFLFSIAATFGLLGCGGSISVDPEPQLGDAIVDVLGDARVETGRDGGRPDSPSDGRPEVRDGRVDTYVEPLCPDAPAPPPKYECDPLATPGTCGVGQACFPYVDYPTEPCEHERYGSLCEKAGVGKQGDPCGSALNCAGGFVCLVTGAGNVCAQMCKAGAPGVCPEGLICSPFDVPGFGGCL